MNALAAALLAWTLMSPSSGGQGGGAAWPTHTACRNGDLQVLYRSCDPLQDFGFSIDQCSKHLKANISIRFGIILREDIRELFLDVALISKGSSVFNFSYPICEEDLPKFSFCGRRKGDVEYVVLLFVAEKNQSHAVHSPPLVQHSFTHPETAAVEVFYVLMDAIGVSTPRSPPRPIKSESLGIRSKLEQIYYAGPIDNLGFEIPQGEYQVLLELYNENHSIVACANATVISS